MIETLYKDRGENSFGNLVVNELKFNEKKRIGGNINLHNKNIITRPLPILCMK